MQKISLCTKGGGGGGGSISKKSFWIFFFQFFYDNFIIYFKLTLPKKLKCSRNIGGLALIRVVLFEIVWQLAIAVKNFCEQVFHLLQLKLNNKWM